MHLFFINHSLTLSIATGVILASLSTTAFLFLFALPVTLYLITSGLHTIFAHSSQNNEGSIHGARNLWLLEFIIPMGGEWIHKEHHDKPKLNNWHTKLHYFDLGGMMIQLIKRNAKPTT
jgi:hypothetical protein